MTAIAQPALDIRGLTAGYDSTTVLRDVSLTAPSGSVTALLGPNGAGKTTLLRAACGFLPATRGTIAVNGTEVTRMPAHRRFRLGMCLVPEGRGIFRGLTVRENLSLQANGTDARAALDKAVDAFPFLGKRLGQTAGLLSGGEQQMLALCAAYLTEPQLILVDEASLGLAPLVVDEIFGFLRRLTERGAALLIVDQFVNRALAIADTAFVMTHGTITYRGSAERLLDSDVFEHYVSAAPAPSQ